MKFSDTTTQTGLIQDCETLLGFTDGYISGNSNRLNRFTSLINAWYRKADSFIWEATGAWEFDDSNRTDLPIATTDLVDDQRDYELPSTARKVDRVEVLDDSGDWSMAYPIDKSDITTTAMEEYEETNGLPEYYDMVGRSILLYPKPASGDVTTTNGLKLYCSRDIVAFSSSATTREPGFDNHFHRICSIGAAYDYANSRGYSSVSRLKRDLNELKAEIQTFYGTRHRDRKTRLDVQEGSNI